MERIVQSDAALGDIFSRCIKTGTFCSYQPDPDFPIAWEFAATDSGIIIEPTEDLANSGTAWKMWFGFAPPRSVTAPLTSWDWSV
jgi:hypothetical protein